MTLNKLQLFTMTTAGKDAYTTAWLYVYILKLTTKPQTIALFQGIARDYLMPFKFDEGSAGLRMYLYARPIIVATSWGKMVKIIAS